MKTERMRNSFFNSVSSVLVLFTSTILSFIVRTYFIKTLGEQCLGLDGLFTNILSLLSISELGLAMVISFSLYKPLAQKNQDKINKIMSFYKKIYIKMAFIVLGISFLFLPFLKFMVKDYTINYNIYLIYMLYVGDSVFSYFTSYKAILIEADQKNYLLTPIRILFNVLTYGLQLLFLILTKNLVFYLVIRLIFRQLENIAINIFISKKYPNVDFNCKKKVDHEDIKTIKENVKGVLFHKLGNYAVNGTDNILISSIINISTAGLYTNYLSLITIIRNLITGVITSATSSFGNLNVSDTAETKFNIFNIINFVCFFVTGMFTLGIYFLINIFIEIWIGSSFALNSLCVLFITLNFYLIAMLQPIETVKNSTGLYYIDRYVPIVQAIINLVLSFLLGKKFGLVGILASTTISYILTVSWSKAFIIYKHVFKEKLNYYFKKQIKNLLTLLISVVIIGFIYQTISIQNLYLAFIIKGIILVSIFSVVFLLANLKSKELKFFVNLVKNKE